jgi:hypothetical protein
MHNYTPEQLTQFPWVASCDTLKAEDLLPKFWQVAEMVAVLADRPQLLNAETLASLTKLVGEDSKESDWNDEEANLTLEDLSLALDDAAPAGFYFGASEGDGAAFGFWLDEAWGDALDSCSVDTDCGPERLALLVAELSDLGYDSDNLAETYCGEAEGYSEAEAGADAAAMLAEAIGEGAADSMRWPYCCIDWAEAWEYLQQSDGYRLARVSPARWLVLSPA